MRFVYGKQDMQDPRRAQENCWLLANGLGGFSSTTGAFSVNRSDQGILIAARTAPNDRVNLVHRLSERLVAGEEQLWLSTQDFADGRPPEDGWRQLSSFQVEYGPRWTYEARGTQVLRQLAVEENSNTVALRYRLENRSDRPWTLELVPWLQFSAKGEPPQEPFPLAFRDGRVTDGALCLYVKTDGQLEPLPCQWQRLAYDRDARDGRPSAGVVGACCRILKTVAPGRTARVQVLFSTDPVTQTAASLLGEQTRRLKQRQGHFRHPVARQLAMAAGEFVAHRASTGGKTLLAGFPFFGDWGRDTMIALPGCVLAREDYETAKSILRTFLAYEKDGLVPNLFPEGESKPMYNTADAPLLLINCLWQYLRRQPDPAFLKESFPVLKRIIAAYRNGTHHGIAMDRDGLIRAGQGMDQVTWMDVCVEGILPTPRHGKPVEINAYWYSALKVMAALAPEVGESGQEYEALAARVRRSFRAFWLEEEGYLKDVLSGAGADDQLRCNQVWALTVPFSPVDRDQGKRILEALWRQLYTPVGLRTLSPEDPQFRPHYGGSQRQRDLAYHQGTVWPFPLGAFYLAWLKVHGNTPAVRRRIYRQLEPLEAALREGCVGQLPEIYEGGCPGASQGCFAQAWSVGELLRVYEALEKGDPYEV